jgi:hypothetical protein
LSLVSCDKALCGCYNIWMLILFASSREERPDVDQVYMTAAQLLTGSGGGPWMHW